jgi:hypothetical protein
MTLARAQLVDPAITRCVRRAHSPADGLEDR